MDSIAVTSGVIIVRSVDLKHQRAWRGELLLGGSKISQTPKAATSRRTPNPKVHVVAIMVQKSFDML